MLSLKSASVRRQYSTVVGKSVEYNWNVSWIAIISGDIEISPDPQSFCLNQSLSICHWNLNRLSALSDYVDKIFTSISIHYLSSETTFDEDDLKIPGYNFMREDNLRMSQTKDEFEPFFSNFVLILDKTHGNNPFMTVAVGEFIAKSKSWCKNDITSLYDSMTNAVTSDYGLDQHSQEPTYSLNS